MFYTKLNSAASLRGRRFYYSCHMIGWWRSRDRLKLSTWAKNKVQVTSTWEVLSAGFLLQTPDGHVTNLRLCSTYQGQFKYIITAAHLYGTDCSWVDVTVWPWVTSTDPLGLWYQQIPQSVCCLVWPGLSFERQRRDVLPLVDVLSFPRGADCSLCQTLLSGLLWPSAHCHFWPPK